MAESAFNNMYLSALEAHREATQSDEDTPELIETQVYIGLNDAETKKQEHATERYAKLMKRVCVEYGVPFSFDIIDGGYVHDNGEYTEEKTIQLTFIDVDKDTIDQIAQDLCVFFRQESVLITTDRIRVRTVHSMSE